MKKWDRNGWIRDRKGFTQKDLTEYIRAMKRFRWNKLDLSQTQIRELPDSIAQLTNLQSLTLSFTNIRKIPGNIAQLTNLHWLDLSRTLIREIPDSIAQLTNLHLLDLSRNQISEIPDSIVQLTKLHWLDLSRNQISEIPNSIGQLTNLKSLNLSATKISEIPNNITQLTNLQSLTLWGTKISEIPDSITQLTNLKSLDLSRTQISETPDNITQLTKLHSLDLSRTNISEIPDSIGQLTNLQSLDLSHTNIHEIPGSITQLTNLQSLNLSYCTLKKIPFSLVQLGLPFVIDNPNVNHCINLTGVTLEEGDITLFSQPREVIEEYYRNRTLEAVDECKVIFLGDGGGGKSFLIERLIHDTFEKDSLPTDGVKMTKWETTLNGRPFTLRFLDFGGQEIMHSMHRCFLTNHTVYVVVCESRDDTEIDSAAARWLETVRAFSPDCPVILALNKADLNSHVSVNEWDLRQRNPALKCVLKTSAAVKPGHKFGVHHLLDEVMEAVPGCVRKMSGNRNFLGLKRELESMEETGTDYLNPEQFQKQCERFSIAENLREGLLDWFQDLGVAYTYSATFRNWYVLNPAWLTNGIYRLILRTPEGGFLEHSTIQAQLAKKHPRDINPEKKYSAEEMGFILYIMRKFQISHEIREGVEMIPLKLPKTPPDSVERFQRKDALHLRWEGAYLPNNLIHRLLIRKVQELDMDCVWRTGGWFRQTGGGCTALAEMNEKTLDIYVRGRHDARVYLETFRELILQILGQLGIPAKEYVYYSLDGRTGKVSYQTVLSRFRAGRDVFIEDLDVDIPAADLLRENYVDSPARGMANDFHGNIGTVIINEGSGNTSIVTRRP